MFSLLFASRGMKYFGRKPTLPPWLYDTRGTMLNAQLSMRWCSRVRTWHDVLHRRMQQRRRRGVSYAKWHANCMMPSSNTVRSGFSLMMLAVCSLLHFTRPRWYGKNAYTMHSVPPPMEDVEYDNPSWWCACTPSTRNQLIALRHIVVISMMSTCDLWWSPSTQDYSPWSEHA